MTENIITQGWCDECKRVIWNSDKAYWGRLLSLKEIKKECLDWYGYAMWIGYLLFGFKRRPRKLFCSLECKKQFEENEQK